MIHYTCDRCKCAIDPEEEVRYVVHVEVQAVHDLPDQPRSEEGDDSLLELHEILEQLEEEEEAGLGEETRQRRRYDLCAQCHQQYLRNPLGREMGLPMGFSQN